MSWPSSSFNPQLFKSCLMLSIHLNLDLPFVRAHLTSIFGFLPFLHPSTECVQHNPPRLSFNVLSSYLMSFIHRQNVSIPAQPSWPFFQCHVFLPYVLHPSTECVHTSTTLLAFLSMSCLPTLCPSSIDRMCPYQHNPPRLSFNVLSSYLMSFIHPQNVSIPAQPSWPFFQCPVFLPYVLHPSTECVHTSTTLLAFLSMSCLPTLCPSSIHRMCPYQHNPPGLSFNVISSYLMSFIHPQNVSIPAQPSWPFFQCHVFLPYVLHPSTECVHTSTTLLAFLSMSCLPTLCPSSIHRMCPYQHNPPGLSFNVLSSYLMSFIHPQNVSIPAQPSSPFFQCHVFLPYVLHPSTECVHTSTTLLAFLSMSCLPTLCPSSIHRMCPYQHNPPGLSFNVLSSYLMSFIHPQNVSIPAQPSSPFFQCHVFLPYFLHPSTECVHTSTTLLAFLSMSCLPTLFPSSIHRMCPAQPSWPFFQCHVFLPYSLHPSTECVQHNPPGLSFNVMSSYLISFIHPQNVSIPAQPSWPFFQCHVFLPYFLHPSTECVHTSTTLLAFLSMSCLPTLFPSSIHRMCPYQHNPPGLSFKVMSSYLISFIHPQNVSIPTQPSSPFFQCHVFLPYVLHPSTECVHTSTTLLAFLSMSCLPTLFPSSIHRMCPYQHNPPGLSFNVLSSYLISFIHPQNVSIPAQLAFLSMSCLPTLCPSSIDRMCPYQHNSPFFQCHVFLPYFLHPSTECVQHNPPRLSFNVMSPTPNSLVIPSLLSPFQSHTFHNPQHSHLCCFQKHVLK